MTGGRVCHFLGAGALQLAMMRAVQNAIDTGWVILIGIAWLIAQYGIARVWEYRIQGWIVRTFTAAYWDPRPDEISVLVVPFGALAGFMLWIWLPW